MSLHFPFPGRQELTESQTFSQGQNMLHMLSKTLVSVPNIPIQLYKLYNLIEPILFPNPINGFTKIPISVSTFVSCSKNLYVI